MRSSRRAALRNQKILLGSITFVIALTITCSILFGTINAQAAPAEPSYKYYTSIQVQQGDTLWDIADTYITDEYNDMNEYIREICSINHIDEDAIHAGQYLTIPYYSAEYLE